MTTLTTHQLSVYLKSQTGGIQPAIRFLMINRPRICPFDDLLTLLPQGRRVLDIGCGHGAFLLLLARYRAPSHILGLDIDPVAVRNARRLLARCPFAESYRVETYDGQSLPSIAQTAEYLFLIDVFHHVPEESQKAFLGRIFDVMRSGATLVMKDIDAANRVLAIFNLMHDLVVARQMAHAISVSRAEQLLSGIGFAIGSVQKQRRLCYPHYTIVARKP